uniref:Putative secreted protein n=1 Tax=Ixodes ricinus TaxID=34613 RepID=A0A6B0V5U2_IXORI
MRRQWSGWWRERAIFSSPSPVLFLFFFFSLGSNCFPCWNAIACLRSKVDGVDGPVTHVVASRWEHRVDVVVVALAVLLAEDAPSVPALQSSAAAWMPLNAALLVPPSAGWFPRKKLRMCCPRAEQQEGRQQQHGTRARVGHDFPCRAGNLASSGQYGPSTAGIHHDDSEAIRRSGRGKRNNRRSPSRALVFLAALPGVSDPSSRQPAPINYSAISEGRADNRKFVVDRSRASASSADVMRWR